MDQATNPRSQILESYQLTIEDSFRENRPRMKLINFGTGSGKTHMLFESIYDAIQKYPTQIIGVYVAPLREHLQIPNLVSDKYSEIPNYKIHSLEMKTTDEYLNKYKQWIPKILKNKAIWSRKDKKYSFEQTQENKNSLARVIGVIHQIEYLKKANFGNKETHERLLQDATRDLDKLIEGFIEFFIKSNEKEETWIKECQSLVEIFFPLHLLREKSGIILLTYDKYRTSLPYFKRNNETWIRQNSTLDIFVQKNTEIKFIFAFDEQEDGYERMLNSMIDIISPQALAINNALSSINREFSALLSNYSLETRKLLKFIDNNRGALDEFEEYAERNKPVEKDLEKLYGTYQRLIHTEGNSRNFLTQLTKINKSLEEALSEVSNVFDEHNEGEPLELDFEMLVRVFEKFENNRSLLIHHELYNKIKDDLANIFSHNNLYIYNIEPLRKLFLTRSSGGHVFISETPAPESTSLAELIYAILAIRLQIKLIEKFLANVLDAEDSQSRSIDIWAKQISRIQKDSQEDSPQNQTFNKYLDRNYVYESYKSIINIMEIDRYQNPSNNLVNYDLREVSIGSTALLASPEQKITSLVTNNNIVFLISATGGITGDLSTSYDMRYLEDKLRDETGKSRFKTMSQAEVLLCEEIRNHRLSSRQVTVGFFSQDSTSFPNSTTRDAADRFNEQILGGFLESLIAETGWFSEYKKQELRNFVYFLFYLFEDESTNQTIAFTQTLRWIKLLVRHCEQLRHGNFIFEASPEHPGIYYIRINYRQYQSQVKVKLILYESTFNSHYFNKENQTSYLNELIEKSGEKIFFISAYQSASKGLNPVIGTNGNSTKDFDSLVLLMDSYYSVMKPRLEKPKDSTHTDTRYHFALMKSVVKVGNLNLEIKDFNKYLNQPEAEEFRRLQHKILLGKGTLQAIGRAERRDFPKQVVKIFINEETRKNLLNFYKYLAAEEPNEIRKLSVNNYSVFLRVQEEEQKRAIPNYAEHTDNEAEAYRNIQSFREKMLRGIDKFHQDNGPDTITTAWDALRDPIVFKEPQTYLEKLRAMGVFPNNFIESLFYYNTKPTEFTPYLATIEDSGQKFKIISDSVNGDDPYAYQARLYPENFKANTRTSSDLDEANTIPTDSSTHLVYRLYNELIPHPDIFNTYIPRPNFFYDVLYPSLAEHFVARWIQQAIFLGKDWKKIKSIYGFEPLQDFTKYNQLYERFDLFYIQDNELLCIDVKAWSRESGNRLSQKTLEKAQNKINLIHSEYPEFNEVKGLLLNLHGEKEKNHKYSTTLYSGNLIYFDDCHFPIASKILRNFLLSKEI